MQCPGPVDRIDVFPGHRLLVRAVRIVAFVLGLVIALAGLAAGIYFDQTYITTASLLVAVFAALSPSVIPSVSDEIQANNERYARHRDYFGGVILPTAGSMQVLPAHSIRLLPENRAGWRIGDQDLGYLSPGRSEERIPAYQEVFIPHLLGVTKDAVWLRLRGVWNDALEGVKLYTAKRREFDSAFATRVDGLLKQLVDNGLDADWSDVTIANAMVTGWKYQASVIRGRCESWYSGEYSRPARTWFHPAIAAENMLYGASWAITESTSSIPFLWGGNGSSVPANLSELPEHLDRVLDQLRFDSGLKHLFEVAEEARLDALALVEPLSVAAEDATHLLGHGSDIPGECGYCKVWHPRF